MRRIAGALVCAGLIVGLPCSTRARAAELSEIPTRVLRTFGEGSPVALVWAESPDGPSYATHTERLFVVDRRSDTISRFTPDGELELRFGAPGDGPGELATPWSISADRHGNLYVADTGNDRIQVFDWNGKFLRTIGRSGSGPGELRDPRAVYVDDWHLEGSPIAVGDTGNDRMQLFTHDGAFKVQVPLGEPIALAYTSYGGLLASSAELRALRSFSPGRSPVRFEVLPFMALLRKEADLALVSAIAEADEGVLIGDAERARVLVVREQAQQIRGTVKLALAARGLAWGKRREVPSFYVADGRRVVEIGFEIDSPIPVWLAMVDALERRDIEGALAFIHPLQRPLFREIYHDIAPDLPQEARSMRDVVVDKLRENEAILRIRWVEQRGGKSEPRSSPVHCVRMPDGSWKVYDY